MITADYQKLEPGSEIRLLEIDGSVFGMDDVLYFHGHSITHSEAEIPPLEGMKLVCLQNPFGGRVMNICHGLALLRDRIHYQRSGRATIAEGGKY